MNKCNFLGRFVEDPTIEDVHNTSICRFKVNVEEHRKNKEGYTKKRNNILTFEAWDTAAKAIYKQAKFNDYIVIEAIARNYNDSLVFRVTNFKIFKEFDHE